MNKLILLLVIAGFYSCKKEDATVPTANIYGNYSGDFQRIKYGSTPSDIKFTVTGTNSNIIITVTQGYQYGWQSGEPINGTMNNNNDLTLNCSYNITGLSRTLTGTGHFSSPTLILEYDIVDYHSSQGGYVVSAKYKITATKQ